VTLSQIIPNERVAIRTGTILNPVLKFQVNHACFYREEARTRKRRESGKKEAEDKRKNRGCAV